MESRISMAVFRTLAKSNNAVCIYFPKACFRVSVKHKKVLMVQQSWSIDGLQAPRTSFQVVILN